MLLPALATPGCDSRSRLVQDLYRQIASLAPAQAQDRQPQLVSWSLAIPTVDPLAVLRLTHRPEQRHFYWENPQRGEAIAALGTTCCAAIDSGDRFARAQAWLDRLWAHCLVGGDRQRPLAGARAFASFAFFASPPAGAAPFPRATVCLPQFHLASCGQTSTLVVNLDLSAPGEPETTLSRCDRLLAQIERARCPRQRSETAGATCFLTPPVASFQRFERAARAAVAAIRAGQFSKVVLAHPLDIVASTALNPVDALERLRQHYPDCYYFSIGNGRGSYFLGASPERLASIRESLRGTLRERHLVVDALAGSNQRGRNAVEDACLAQQLLNSEKDRREHQAVSDYLSEQLRALGLQPQLAPRRLRQLANIQHLWTPIAASLPPHVRPLDLVARLHPTPAVAGVPTQTACEQIRQYEDFERGLYAAPLGWLDARGNGEFVVGIRSALLSGARARLYAGAGIVAGSDPERELAEVQLKLQAMLAALGAVGSRG